MKILIYTPYKEHFDLYTETHCPIAVNSTGAEDRHIKFTLSAGIYSIDDFNAQVKVVVLQQRQYWEAPQIKDLKLFIPERCIFMASDSVFYCAWNTQQPS